MSDTTFLAIDYEKLLAEKLTRLEALEKEYNILKECIGIAQERGVYGDIKITITRNDQVKGLSWGEILQMAAVEEMPSSDDE